MILKYDNLMIEKDPEKQRYMDRLVHKTERKQDYNKSKLFIGWQKHYEWVEASTQSFWYRSKREKTPLFLDISTSNVFLVLGDRGSGKSFLVRGFGSRVFESGYGAIYLSDIKNEMRTNNKPVQPKFSDKLMKYEKPKAIPTVTFTPYFLKRFSKKRENNKLLQIDFADLEETDIITAFNAEDSEPQKDVVKDVFRKMKDGTIETFDEMEEYIKNMPREDVHGSTKKAFYLKLRDMKRKKAFGSEYKRDFRDYINNSVISINFKGYDDVESYPHVYMSFLIEQIRRAKKKGEIKRPVFFFIDEAHAFLPKRSDPSCKEKIIKVINEDRQLGESVVISTQYPDQLPYKKVLRQVRYYFFPWNIDMSVFLDVIKSTGMHRKSHIWSDKWQKLHSKAKKYEWIVIDKTERKVHIVKIAAPLCKHLEEKRN